MTIPGMVRQVARVVDPTIRQRTEITDHIVYQIPKFSKVLPKQVDALGEEKRIQQPISAMFAMNKSTQSKDIVDRELFKLSKESKIKTGRSFNVGWPSPSFRIKGKNVKIEPVEYAKFMQASAPFVKQTLRSLFSSPEWDTLPLSLKQDTIRKVVNDMRATEKAIIQAEVLQKKAETGELLDIFIQE
jgi:hypothetical protein